MRTPFVRHLQDRRERVVFRIDVESEAAWVNDHKGGLGRSKHAFLHFLLAAFLDAGQGDGHSLRTDGVNAAPTRRDESDSGITYAKESHARRRIQMIAFSKRLGKEANKRETHQQTKERKYKRALLRVPHMRPHHTFVHVLPIPKSHLLGERPRSGPWMLTL